MEMGCIGLKGCVVFYLLFNAPAGDREGCTAVRWGTATGGPSEWKVLGMGVGMYIL